MAVKIFIGGEDSIPALLAKQKTSWDQLEQKTDEFGKATVKAERAAISHGKALVKQHRSEEQALKDRVAAVQAAARKEEITQEQKIETIRKIIGKYREERDAAKKAATEATTAFKAGTISGDNYKTSLQQLQVEQVQTGKKGRKSIGPEFLSMAAGAVGGIASIATAWRTATAVVEFYNSEKNKAMEVTNSLDDSRRSLRQVSKGDFDQLEQRSDNLTKFGITREQARELVFSGVSTGFKGEEATVAMADPVIAIKDGAAFAGEFRKFFGAEKLSIEQAFNTALAGAAGSKFNITEMLPQIRTASQGALAGGESSDVVAAVAVLADKFGQSTGDRLRALGGKVALDERTSGLNLIDAIKKLQGDKTLRDDILKDNSQLQEIYVGFVEGMNRIVAVDKQIEREQRASGRAGLIGKAIAEAMDQKTESGRIEVSRRNSIAAEQQSAIQVERRLSAEAFKTKTAVSNAEREMLNDPNSTATRRYAASTAAGIASNFTSDAGDIKYASRFGSDFSKLFTEGGESIGSEREQQSLAMALEVQEKGFKVLESASNRQNELSAQQIEILNDLKRELKGATLSRPGVDR